MKNLCLLILVSLFFNNGLSAKSQSTTGFQGFEKNQSSVSFFAGQPVFLRYSKFLTWKRSLSLDAGYHFDKYPYFAGNYSVYFYNVKDHIKEEENFFNSLLFYVGPGIFLGPDFGEAKSTDKIKIGVRVFGGAEYIFKNSPLSLSAELGSALFIEGSSFVGFQGMLGLTYYIDGIKIKKLKSRATKIQDNTVN